MSENAAAWDLMATTGLLVEFLSAADAGRAERASKNSHPLLGLVTLRERALIRFPSLYRLDGDRPGDPSRRSGTCTGYWSATQPCEFSMLLRLGEKSFIAYFAGLRKLCQS